MHSHICCIGTTAQGFAGGGFFGSAVEVPEEQAVRPFSIELIRPDFSVIEDLLFLDEDLIKIEPPLLDGVGEELDRFLDELLEDLK